MSMKRRPARSHKKPFVRRWFRPLLEQFEQRVLLASQWLGGSGDWTDASHWSTGRLPGSNDDVVIDDGATVAFNTSAEVHSLVVGSTSGLNLAGGGLTLDNASSLQGSLTWSAGNLAGSGVLTITSTGTLTISGQGRLFSTINNSGTIEQTSPSNLLMSNGVINNEQGGTYDFAADSGLQPFFGGSTLNNFGTVKKSVGSPNSGTTISGTFDNEATSAMVEVDQGVLNLAGGSSQGGTFNVASGAVLDLTGGSDNTYGGTYTGTGQGVVRLQNGTLHVAPSGATFNFPGTLLQWSGGNLVDNTLTNIGVFNITGQGRLFNTINNTGTIEQPSPSNLLMTNGVINNQQGGIYDFAADSALQPFFGSSTLNNFGTVKKSVGSPNSGTTISGTFDNESSTAVVEVDQGVLNLAGSNSQGGTFNVAANAVLDLTGDSDSTYGGTYTGSGQGVVRLQNGTLHIAPSGATFNFPGKLFQWSGGNLVDNTLTNTGVFNITGQGRLFNTINNTGTIEQPSASNLLMTNGVINNQQGGTYDFAADSGLQPFFGGSTLNNFGTVKKSVGNPNSGTTISGTFVNESTTAVVEVDQGVLNLAGSNSQGGTFNVAANAVLDLTGGSDSTYAGTYTGSGQGVVRLQNGTLHIAPSGATFDFPGTLFQWSGGNLVDNTLTNTGVFNITGQGRLFNTIANRGIIEDISPSNLLVTNGEIDNQPTGVIDFHSDAGLQAFFGGSTLNNAGTVEKTAGSANSSSVVSGNVNNLAGGVVQGVAGVLNLTGSNSLGGTYDVSTGAELDLGGGSSQGGTFNVASGGILDLTGGSDNTYGGTYTGSGQGIIRLQNGTLHVAPGGATFDFPGTLFQWSGGNMVDNTLTNTGVINVTGQGRLSTTINNAGTIRQSTTSNLLMTNGVINNESGGVYDFAADGGLQPFFGGSTLNNLGTVKKSAGSPSASSYISGSFNNAANGVIEVDGGVLELGGGSNQGGTFNVASGGVLDLTGGGDVTYGGTYTGSGQGVVRLQNGTLHVAQGGATFDFPGTLFQWSGGNLVDNTLTNTGVLNITGQGRLFSTLDNSGTIEETGTGNLLVTNGTINNLQGATYAFAGDNGVQPFFGGSTFNNSGTVVKTAGTGTSTLGGTVNNLGTVEADSGTLSLNGSLTQLSGNTLSGGTWNAVVSGSLNLNANVTTDQASVALNGPGASIPSLANLDTIASGGSLTVTNGATFATRAGGNLTNDGSLTVGPAGTLTVRGNYSQDAGAGLTAEIGGTPASGQFGLLNVTGNAALAGTVTTTLANGFGPVPPETYTVLTAGSTSGSFGTVKLPLGNTPLFTASLSPTALVLNTTGNPSPDLAVTGITLPPVGEVGRTVAVSYTVSNRTTTPEPGAWFDDVLLSPDGLPGEAILLGQVHHTGGVAGNASYQETLTAPVPNVAPGIYQVLVVADVLGLVPDSNRANNTLASGTTFPVNPATALRIVGSTPPAGQVAHALSSVLIQFNKPIQQSSFTTSQVAITGPLGAIAASSITKVDDADYAIQFPAQTIAGTYTFQVGPDILDLVGGAMDQNGDGTPGEPNDVFALSVQLSSPSPDLTTDAVTVAATGSTGQAVPVTWRVTNQGSAPTGSLQWSDRVFLSADGKLDSSSIPLGTFTHTGALNPGDSYSQAENVALPLALATGSYTIFVQADVFGQVPEFLAQGHQVAQSAAPVVVSLAPAADLVASAISTTTSTAVIGQPVTLTWTVQNNGNATASAPWTDQVYLSPDGKLADATLLTSFTETANLAAGGQVRQSKTITLPNISDGNDALVLVVNSDGKVFERNTTNDTLVVSGALTVQHPDLTVENVTTTPVGPYQSGDTVTVNWVDHNVGSGASTANWTDAVFLSKDGTLNGATSLGQLAQNGVLAAGQTLNRQLAVALPNGVTGTFQIVVQTNARGEVDEGSASTNDTGASTAVTISLAPFADLSVTASTPQTLLVGNPVDLTVTWTVTNSGTGPGKVDQWNDRVLLSASGGFGSSDNIVLTPDVPHQGLMPPGTSYTQTQTFTLPANLQGRFHVLVKTNADNKVFEGPGTFQEVADVGHTLDVTPAPFSQLVVNPVMADPTAKSGQPLTVSWQVTNQGIATTDVSQWNDTVTLSTDPTGRANVIPLGTFVHSGALGVGDSYTRTLAIPLPSNAPSGTYFVFVNSSGPYQFLHTDQDTGRSAAVAVTFVPPPQVDLQVTPGRILLDNSPNSVTVADGQQLDVTWSVQNNGPQDTTAGWNDTLTLVPTGGNTGSPVTLGTFQRVGGLGAGLHYTRTELVTLPQHIQGLYLLAVQTDSASAVPETDKNPTTGADANDILDSAPLTVALTPRPNLAVSINQATSQVTAGGAIDLQWTVTDLGAATPVGNSRWSDSVYVSLDGSLAGAILLGSVPNGSALVHGQSYSSSAHFVLPAALSGNVHLIVQADSGSVLDEFPAVGPHTASAALAITSQPVPPPDLVTSNVFGPGTAFDGTTVTVHYHVANLGTGVTFPATWTDSIWLTTGKGHPNPQAGDILLGNFGHTGALNVGGSYDNNVPVTLPAHVTGQYFLTAWTNSTQNVFQVTLDTNVNPDDPHTLYSENYKATPLTILPTPLADLEVTAVSAPATARGGDPATVSWSVANNGANATDGDSWVDAVYISTTPTLDTGEHHVVFAQTHQGALEPGQSYNASATFPLPPSAKGQFFIVRTNDTPGLVLTSDQLFQQEVDQILNGTPPAQALTEQSTTNNTRAAASTITDIPADLAVTGVQADATAFSGEPVHVNWTVTNQGPNPVWSGTTQWNDYVFVSPSPVFDPHQATLAATALHRVTSPLNPGASYTNSTTITLPEGFSGPEFLYVFSDRDPGRGLDPVAAGDFPSWPGTFSGRVWEGSDPNAKANNTGSTSVAVTYREAALKIGNLVLGTPQSPLTAANAGDTISVQFTVTNVGTRTTRVDSWFDRVYLSRDGSLDAADPLLGSFAHQGFLDPGQSYTATGTVRLPDNIQGPFQVLAYTDSPFDSASPPPATPYDGSETGPARIQLAGNPMGRVHEFQDETLATHLLAAPLTLTALPLPDLRVTTVAAVSDSPQDQPGHVTLGNNVTVTWTVKNVGPGAVPDREGTWVDYVYLSRDQYLDANSDHFVGSVTHTGALLAGQSYSGSLDFNIPHGLSGPYFVFVLTDAPNGAQPRGAVLESNEGNNATVTPLPLLLDQPPPADLEVDRVTVPDSAVEGQLVTVSWTVSNHSKTQTAAGIWADAAYLSTSPTWDLSDPLLGTVQQGSPRAPAALAPGQSYTATLTAALPVALPGSYFIIVRPNVFNDIPNKTNLPQPSAGTFTLTVPTLELGVPLADQLGADQSRLYEVPQVAVNQTLEVDFTSTDQSAENELYVRYQGLPSSAHFDAEFPGHLTADQTAVVPSTQAGDYFVLVRNDAGNPGATQITAKLLPFQVTDVTPDHGGDGQYVTMTITGAAFDPQATVKLLRPQRAEFVPVNYQVVNATKIIATFDLTGAARPVRRAGDKPGRFRRRAAVPLRDRGGAAARRGGRHGRPDAARCRADRRLQRDGPEPDQRRYAVCPPGIRCARAGPEPAPGHQPRAEAGAPHRPRRPAEPGQRPLGQPRPDRESERDEPGARLHGGLRDRRHRRPVVHRRRLPRPARESREGPEFPLEAGRSARIAGHALRFLYRSSRHADDERGVPHLPGQHRRGAAPEGPRRSHGARRPHDVGGRPGHLGQRLPRRADRHQPAPAPGRAAGHPHHRAVHQLRGDHHRRPPRRSGRQGHPRGREPDLLLRPGQEVVWRHPRHYRHLVPPRCRPVRLAPVSPDPLRDFHDPRRRRLRDCRGDGRRPGAGGRPHARCRADPETGPEPDRLLRPDLDAERLRGHDRPGGRRQP